MTCNWFWGLFVCCFTTLLNSCILIGVCGDVCVYSGFSIQKTSTSFLPLPYILGCLLCIFLTFYVFFLIMVSRTSNPMLLNRSDESGHPCLFLILKKLFYFWTMGMFQLFELKTNVLEVASAFPDTVFLCTSCCVLASEFLEDQVGISPQGSLCVLNAGLFLSLVCYLKGRTDSPGQNFNSKWSKSQEKWNSETAHLLCCSHTHDTFSYFHLFNHCYRQELELEAMVSALTWLTGVLWR